MVEFIQPFDFKRIIIDYLLGSIEIFPFVFIIAMSLIAGYLGMSKRIFGVVLMITSITFGFILGSAILAFTLLATGFILFRTLATIFDK